MAHVVLAHGILGFGTLPVFGLESPYFNGVAVEFRRQGHAVLVPTVDLLGSLELRSTQLAQAIQGSWPGQDQLVVIAHSMGGLDIRRAVSRSSALAARVRAIATIGTPHLGSPVADAVMKPEHPLRPHIPLWLLAALGNRAGAVPDLCTRSELHDPDVAGIRYLEIAGDCRGVTAVSPLFSLVQAIGHLSPEGNDGVVTLTSAAVPHRPLADIWPTDHCGEIGWPTGNHLLDAVSSALSPPADHIARYDQLLSRLLA